MAQAIFAQAQPSSTRAIPSLQVVPVSIPCPRSAAMLSVLARLSLAAQIVSNAQANRQTGQPPLVPMAQPQPLGQQTEWHVEVSRGQQDANQQRAGQLQQ